MVRARRSALAGAELLTPRRKWRAIMLATLVLVPSYWSVVAGLVSVASERKDAPAPGPFIAFGLALVPFADLGIWTRRVILPTDAFTDLATEVVTQDPVQVALTVAVDTPPGTVTLPTTVLLARKSIRDSVWPGVAAWAVIATAAPSA